ncbi:sulfatase [Candidatus Aerophobetes bacterium]|nr:sulfatase [Candidatus Aerophobetes bacterium]
MKNVILFTIDTLRKDVLGCYNPDSKLTPFLNSLQHKCIRFTNMQSIGPYTQASFPGILTSSYYFDWGRQKKCPPQRKLISEVLKNKGITTAAIHSNPYVSEFFGWKRGWDFFYDSMEDEVTDEVPYVRGDEINRKVDEWLSSHIQGENYHRFFLWLHYMDVHEPYVPKRKYVDMIDSSIDLSSEQMFDLFKTTLLKRDVSDRGKVELLKKLYFAHVLEVDGYAQGFFEILKKYNLLDESVIIITSDHGDEFGEHGGLSHDGKFYSELINMPFLIYQSARDKGEVCDTLISNIDIPPTVVYLFGIEAVDDFKGHSVLPVTHYPEKGCFGEAVDKRSAHEKETDKPTYYYHDGKFKIIYREGMDSWEMYDVEKDPAEKNNIVDSSSLAEKMKEALRPRIRRWVN